MQPNIDRVGIGSFNAAARQRLLSGFGEPWLYSDWLRPVFLHYEIEPERLQRHISFRLDLRDGKGHVSIVAFTMRGLHPRLGGAVGKWLFRPIATHGLLNVRTYVRNRDEAGIYFIAEWIPNRLSEWLGPWTFGLPYRHGRLEYQHVHEAGRLSGKVSSGSAQLVYSGGIEPDAEYQPSEPDSLTEFLLERYTAFTAFRGARKYFRIWHPPWDQTNIAVTVHDDSLLTQTFEWFKGARFAGANYSPGTEAAWMGRPHRLTNSRPTAGGGSPG